MGVGGEGRGEGGEEGRGEERGGGVAGGRGRGRGGAGVMLGSDLFVPPRLSKALAAHGAVPWSGNGGAHVVANILNLEDL